MSYARFGRDSSVYVYIDTQGSLRCCMCQLNPEGKDYMTFRYSAMLRHLRKHQEKEHDVPEYTLSELAREQQIFSDNGKNWDYEKLRNPQLIKENSQKSE